MGLIHVKCLNYEICCFRCWWWVISDTTVVSRLALSRWVCFEQEYVCTCTYMYTLCVCVCVCVCVCMVSLVWPFATPWTVACQAPQFMEFSRQEYWSGLPFPSLGDLPDPGIEPRSPMCPALAGGFFITEPPKKPYKYIHNEYGGIYSTYNSVLCIIL